MDLFFSRLKMVTISSVSSSESFEGMEEGSITYRSYNKESVTISGGLPLKLKWTPYTKVSTYIILTLPT
jgi:hypothetical protein